MSYRLKKVAVKTMKDPKYNFLVDKEAEVLCHLGDHPGLPYLFGVCEKSDCKKMLVLEYCDEEVKPMTLNDAIRSNKINPIIWPGVIRNLANVLCYIHSRGIIHGDIKGDNVLVIKRNQNWHPVIIDFGKSTRIGSLFQRAEKVVNCQNHVHVDRAKMFPHLAPEVISRDNTPNALSDSYSFGRLATYICRKFNCSRRMIDNAEKCYRLDPKTRMTIKQFLDETF